MRRLLSLLVVSCLLSPSLFAWCNTLPRLVCAEYSQSKLVVIAKLTHEQYFEAKGEREGYYIYSLETGTVLRGKVGGGFRVWEENSSGRASFNWKIGKTYLLFLNPTDDGMWWLYGCGNSAPIDESRFTLKVIESMRSRHGGLIQGRISDDGSWPRFPWQADLSGVTIQVRGDKSEYTTVTNRVGDFKIHVPPGNYAVLPVRAGWTFKKDFESYEDPSTVKIETGGCAQVQFMVDMRK